MQKQFCEEDRNFKMLRNLLILNLTLSCVLICRSEYWKEKDTIEYSESAEFARDTCPTSSREKALRKCVHKCLHPCPKYKRRDQEEANWYELHDKYNRY